MLSREICRSLLLQAQAPLVRGSGRKVLLNLIHRLGFVQVDSINVLERAHHLTLRSRMAEYRPEMLQDLLRERQLFEHWTHDASVLPVQFLPYWRYRSRLYMQRAQQKAWWRERLGPEPDSTIARVRRHVAEHGPVTTRDFATASSAGPWWDWKPDKVALEYLWRAGELCISARQGFTKVYDLMERAYPESATQPLPTQEEYHDWAFGQALERLGAATPKELADFWGGLTRQDAANWCASAALQGRVLEVDLEGSGRGVVVPDWEARLRNLKLPREPRLLNPFDPIARDRKRLERLFQFQYRFEAYVPAAKRIHGYFVLPVLERDRFIARLDAKYHRGQALLEIKGLWWEPSVRQTKSRQDGVQQSIARLAAWLGATSVHGPSQE